MDKELKIFISSRGDEFASERCILKESLEKLKMKAIIFEDYGAQDNSMQELNREDVNDCHIFIGLYGMKYSLPTDKEFQLAIKNNKPCLLYFKKNVDRTKLNKNMKNFIKQIKAVEKVYSKFENISEIRDKVLHDVISEISKKYIIFKYEFSEILQKNTNQVVDVIYRYSEYEKFLKDYSTDTKIVKITKSKREYKIIIDKGSIHGLSENIDFNIKYHEKIISRIQVELVQEKISTCKSLDELPKNIEKIYRDCSLTVIELSKRDFVNKMMGWRKIK